MRGAGYWRRGLSRLSALGRQTKRRPLRGAPVATVLMPTHDHAPCLPHSIGSVLEQTVPDFELLVVGDGVGDDTRAVVTALARRDSRIRFLDLPKGERKGERHRHHALEQARGSIVAYLGDDDLWFPEHLATIAELLREADFGHTLHVGIVESGTWIFLPADLEHDPLRQKMLQGPFNFFDFSFGAHTLAAYRRLSTGWAPPTPDCPWSDLYLWRQFLAEPWCRARSAMVPTAICTQTHRRPERSNEERAQELAALRRQIPTPAFRAHLWRQAATSFARAAVGAPTPG